MAKSHSLKYSKSLPFSSISELIHTQLDSVFTISYDLNKTSRAERVALDAKRKKERYGYFSPPKPFPIVGKGYPYLEVFYDDFHVWFTSTYELDHFCDVYAQKVLPSARDLAEKFDYGQVNRVWISRFPKYKYEKRVEIVKYISKVSDRFRNIADQQQKIAKDNLKLGTLVPVVGDTKARFLGPPFDAPDIK